MQKIKNKLKEIYLEKGRGYLKRFINNDNVGGGLPLEKYQQLYNSYGITNDINKIADNLIKEWGLEEENLHPIENLIVKNLKVSTTFKNNVIKFHTKTIKNAAFIMLANIYKQENVKTIESKRSGSGITVLITIR